MQFVAIDVETANADIGSICQIGIAKFDAGKLIESWSSLVDPEDYFDDINISIHGIDERRVKGQPPLPQLSARIRELMQNTVSVCHTNFDRVATQRAFAKYQMEPIYDLVGLCEGGSPHVARTRL
jgi:DNA polymerase-3 subunit epsilon